MEERRDFPPVASLEFVCSPGFDADGVTSFRSDSDVPAAVLTTICGDDDGRRTCWTNAVLTFLEDAERFNSFLADGAFKEAEVIREVLGEMCGLGASVLVPIDGEDELGEASAAKCDDDELDPADSGTITDA